MMGFINKAVRAQMHRLLDDCIDRNNMGDSTFYQFSGHVTDLDIQLYEGKWSKEQEGVTSTFNLDENYSSVMLEHFAEEMEAELQED